uniref:Uncharacterized protein n=1 Tax=Arundo donax TaxID=35708 RepID=A0A0A9HKI2_ARUDO
MRIDQAYSLYSRAPYLCPAPIV